MAISAIKHITVAIDGSRAAQSAVRYACELARSGASLSFCSTNPHETPDGLRELCEAAVSEARSLVQSIGRARIQRNAGRCDVPSTTRGGIALFIHQLPNGAHPRGSACFNPKLSHLVNQRSTRQSDPISRSILPSDQPVGLVQCLQDMFPIGVGQGA